MAGRPSKYNEDMQFKADAYVLGEYLNHDQVIPSHVGLAIFLDVSEPTLYAWGDEHPAFLGTLARIQAKQHMVLINKGLTSEFSSVITKLALHNHGYSDKQQNELSGPDGKPIEVDQKWEIEVHEVTHD